MSETTLDRNFLTAGKSEFIFQNPGGTKYHFKARKTPDNPNFPTNNTFFLSVYAPDHPQAKWGWCYMGIFNSDHGKVKYTRASVFDGEATESKVAEWAIELMMSGQSAPAGYLLTHVGKCGRCARKLTDPESITRGIGPECIKQFDLPGSKVGVEEHEPDPV